MGLNEEAPIWDYVERNRLRFFEGTAVKYIVKRENREMAIKCVDILLGMFGRQEIYPRSAPVEITPEEFAAVNHLTAEEAEAVRAITFWETRSDLTGVLKLIRRML